MWLNKGDFFIVLGNVVFIYVFIFGLFLSGDFVRANGLQAEDFIVIYLDVKSGKYVGKLKVLRPQIR